MSNAFLWKVADVLEKTATYLDSMEGDKIAALRQAQVAAVNDVATRYAEMTGEELSDVELSKLASDGTALETVRKMLDKTGGAVESMGRPASTFADAAPGTREQARKAAYDRFASFLQS